MSDGEKTTVKLLLARFFWMRGEPPRNGGFLVQDESGKIFFEFRISDAPGRREIRYWRRVKAPMPAPREYLTYNAKVRSAEGVSVPYVHEYR